MNVSHILIDCILHSYKNGFWKTKNDPLHFTGLVSLFMNRTSFLKFDLNTGRKITRRSRFWRNRRPKVYVDVSKISPINKQSSRRLRRNLRDVATKYQQPINSCVLTWNGRLFAPCFCTHVPRQWLSLRGREFTVLVNTLNFQWRDFVYSAKEITVTKQTRFKLNESGENLIVRGPFKNWSILKRLSKYVLVNHVELAVKHCTEMLFEFP